MHGNEARGMVDTVVCSVFLFEGQQGEVLRPGAPRAASVAAPVSSALRSVAAVLGVLCFYL